jgi:hypothetical protein
MSISMEELCKQLLIKSVGFIPDPTIRSILNYLIQSVSEQAESIDQKLERLIGGYYKTGLSYLKDANSVNGARREKWIEDALAQFMHASNVEATEIMQAKSMFYTGACYGLLNEKNTALRWYEQGYETGCKYRQQLMSNMEESWTPSSGTTQAGLARASRAGGAGAIIGLIFVGGIALTTRAIAAKKANDLRDQLILFDNDFMTPLRGLLQSWPSNLPVVRQPLSIPEKKTIF